MNYLKNDQYYLDLYDLLTIQDCLQKIRGLKEVEAETIKKLGDKLRPGQKIPELTNLMLWAVKGERYQNKDKTIKDWVERDKRFDEFIEGVIPFNDVTCEHCRTRLEFENKHLDSFDDKRLRAMIWYKCPECHQRAAYYDNHEKYIPKPKICERCSTEVEEKVTRAVKKITFKYTCASCSHHKTEVLDMGKENKEREERKAKEKELLGQYRQEFCLSEKEGQEFLLARTHLENFSRQIQEWKRKEADPVYQQVKKLKILSILEVEKLVIDNITPLQYIRFAFGQPEIGKYVLVTFTVQDSDSKRREYDSKAALKRTIVKTLEGTNWRLSSDSIENRLGVLTGKLKGLEREDDLVEAIKTHASFEV